MDSILRNLVVWVVLGSLLIYVFNNIENTGAREQISYSQFKEEVMSDRMSVIINDDIFTSARVNLSNLVF